MSLDTYEHWTTEPENDTDAAPNSTENTESRQMDAQEGGGHLVFRAGDPRGNGQGGERLEQEIQTERQRWESLAMAMGTWV